MLNLIIIYKYVYNVISTIDCERISVATHGWSMPLICETSVRDLIFSPRTCNLNFFLAFNNLKKLIQFYTYIYIHAHAFQQVQSQVHTTTTNNNIMV